MLDAFVEKYCLPFDDNLRDIAFDDEWTNIVINRVQPQTKQFLWRLNQLARTEGMVEYHISEAFRSVDAKCMPREEYDTLLESTRDFWVSFFPKKQVKLKAQTASYDFTKASQGVSAYDKKINLLYAAYGRMATQFIPGLLRPEVIMMCGMTEVELSDRVNTILSKFTAENPDVKREKKAADFAEFDSTQGLMAYLLTSVLYVVMGMPEPMVYRLRSHSDTWVMFTSFAKMLGELKFHSGTFETWFRNTFYNMCNIAILYSWEKLAIALFTGDDSALEGVKVRFDHVSTWLADRGLKLKDESAPVIEFAGKFILDDCCVPDPLRRVAKYLSKDYKDVAQYNETIISLRNGLEMIPHQSAFDHACVSANWYYNSTGAFDYVPTSDEMAMLYGFLHHEACNPRTADELIAFRKEILPVRQK